MKGDVIGKSDTLFERCTAYMLLFGVLSYFLIYNTIFISRDSFPPAFDPGSNFLVSYQFYDQLSTNIPLRIFFENAFTRNPYPYPPFFFLSGLILSFFNKLTPQWCSLINHFYFLILFFSTYSIGRKIANVWSGAIAAIAISFFPAIRAFSRIYMIDFALTALVVLCYAFLFSPPKSHEIWWSICLGICVGLGNLTKQSFILYVAPGLLITIVRQLKTQSRYVNLKIILILMIISSCLSLPYYATHLLSAFQTVKGFTSVINHMSEDPPTYLRRLSAFLRVIPEMLSPSFMLLACIGVFPLFFKNRIISGSILISWFLVPLFIVSKLFPVMNWRYILPSLPAAAVCVGVGLPLLFQSLKRRSKLIIICYAFVVLTFGILEQFKNDNLTPQILTRNDIYYKRVYEYGAFYPLQSPIELTSVLCEITNYAREKAILKISILPNMPFFSGTMTILIHQLHLFNNKCELPLGGSLDNGQYTPEMLLMDYWKEYFKSVDYIITTDHGDFTDRRHPPGTYIRDNIIEPVLQIAQIECSRRQLIFNLPLSNEECGNFLVYK